MPSERLIIHYLEDPFKANKKSHLNPSRRPTKGQLEDPLEANWKGP